MRLRVRSQEAGAGVLAASKEKGSTEVLPLGANGCAGLARRCGYGMAAVA